METTQAVLAKLTVAFPANGVPSRVVSHDCNCGDCLFLREHLQGKTWAGVEDEALSQMGSDFALLEFEAFRYYLPAFLRRAYLHPQWTPDILLMYLAPESEEDRIRLGVLTPAQRNEVIQFLKWASSEPQLADIKDDADRALAFWTAASTGKMPSPYPL
jgi:hypothetical protein